MYQTINNKKNLVTCDVIAGIVVGTKLMIFIFTFSVTSSVTKIKFCILQVYLV